MAVYDGGNASGRESTARQIRSCSEPRYDNNECENLGHDRDDAIRTIASKYQLHGLQPS
jgi:hypothetical protein